MKFRVTRTSGFSRRAQEGDAPPCNRAVLEFVADTIQTTQSQLDKSPFKDEWFSTGYGHRESGGEVSWLMREVDELMWTITLPTYESFISFISEFGNCIVSSVEYHGLDGEIEIYDDYRE